jgi:pimeloyl-ACP methyl ester carboxylesterase
MDRRGRGASGDGEDYDLAREIEDVVAVVDSIAGAAGAKVDVYGHSFGGNCAFGAALSTSSIGRLVLYEGWPRVRPEKLVFPREVEERLDGLVRAGEREAALETFMREVVDVPEDDLDAIRGQATWPARVATAHTITRELRAFLEDGFDPAQAARIAVPVLLLTGEDSPEEVRDDPEAVAAALPDARIVVIEGQQHLADVLAPDLFARHMLAFLREPADQEG